MSNEKSSIVSGIKKFTAGALAALCCGTAMLGAMPSKSLNKAFEQTAIVAEAASLDNSVLIVSCDNELKVSSRYYSRNGAYNVVFQNDGNLVIYNKNNSPVWHTGTYGNGATRCVLQTDGNFVMYNKYDQAVWNTRTNGKGSTNLYLSDNGELFTYSRNSRSVVWSSYYNKGFVINPGNPPKTTTTTKKTTTTTKKTTTTTKKTTTTTRTTAAPTRQQRFRQLLREKSKLLMKAGMEDSLVTVHMSHTLIQHMLEMERQHT